MRGGLLPGGERAGLARQHRARQQHPGVEGGHRAVGACARDGRTSDSSVSVSDVPAFRVTAAYLSPRVAPRFTTTTGLPVCAACRTNRSPDWTVSDDPATSSASAASTIA